MAKKVVTSLNIPFQDLDVDKQIQWLVKHSQKVVERLPQLKKELAVYDDKSNEMYNWSKESIELFTKSYSVDLATGTIKGDNKELNDFVSQVASYANKDYAQLRFEATEKRIESFKQSLIESGASQLEYEYVLSILDKMSEEDKENFTRSKLFWNSGVQSSDGILTFMDLYGVTPATANLENWCEQHGIETEKLYYIEGETAKRRGRHKKK